MSDTPIPYGPVTITDAFGPVGTALLKTSKLVAIAGGLVFVALVGMELVSIVGRKLFGFVVPGDVEVLQMGAAFASALAVSLVELLPTTGWFNDNLWMPVASAVVLRACGVDPGSYVVPLPVNLRAKGGQTPYCLP